MQKAVVTQIPQAIHKPLIFVQTHYSGVELRCRLTLQTCSLQIPNFVTFLGNI